MASGRSAQAGSIASRIRQTRGGKLNQSQFGARMRGEGEIAEQIRGMMRVFKRKYGLDAGLPRLRTDLFRPPQVRRGQLRLF